MSLKYSILGIFQNTEVENIQVDTFVNAVLFYIFRCNKYEAIHFPKSALNIYSSKRVKLLAKQLWPKAKYLFGSQFMRKEEQKNGNISH